MSVEELLRICFDIFHKEIEWKGVILSSDIKDALKNLEDKIIIDARTEYSTEAEELREAAFEEGEKYGYDIGFMEGKNDGYDEGFLEGEEEAFDNGYEQGLIDGKKNALLDTGN